MKYKITTKADYEKNGDAANFYSTECISDAVHYCQTNAVKIGAMLLFHDGGITEYVGRIVIDQKEYDAIEK